MAALDGARPAPQADVAVSDHGSMVVLRCWTLAAREWVAESLPEDCPRWGRDGYAIERAYVGAILAGMVGDGLILEDC